MAKYWTHTQTQTNNLNISPHISLVLLKVSSSKEGVFPATAACSGICVMETDKANLECNGSDKNRDELT